MQNEIRKTLNYFAYFSYPPTFEDILHYLGKKTTLKGLKQALSAQIKAKHILQKGDRYTLGGYGIFFKKYMQREAISREKMKIAYKYARFISFLPEVKLVGISGSLSMMNARENDDLDIFIITSAHRLFSARFFCICAAEVMQLRRRRNQPHTQNKVCLNLFFDEVELTIPFKKRNVFVAHEVLQMKPIINKDHTYEHFIWKNKWVQDYFPNKDIKRTSISREKRSVSFLEYVLRRIQLYLIKRHHTTELIYQNQLWFFPRDIQKRLEKEKII